MTLPSGKILRQRYRIEKLLEEGGFGAVYQAWDMTLARHCALKENLETSSEAQRQFEREAKILADLSHPNLPRVIDHFIVPGQGQYLVMDLVEGQDLQAMLDDRGGPLPEAQSLDWIQQVCGALDYLHSQAPAVIHRDIKPANIRITPDKRAMLVDFGIAKFYHPGLKTTLGARAVTPGYSPQEQYGQGTTDARTDIYALGATLYTLLTGEEPPESIQRNLGALLRPPRAINPAVSLATQQAVLKAMEMLPDQRFQTAAEFKAALRGGMAGAKTPAQPPAPPAQRPAPTPLPGKPLPAPRRVATAAIAPTVAQRRSKPGRWVVAVILGGLAIMAAMIAWRLTSRGEAELASPSLAPPTPTLTPAPSEMVYVKAGEFYMGAADSAGDKEKDETPQQPVYLDAFWIDRFEVTNFMYSRCVEAKECNSPQQSGSKTRSNYYGNERYKNYPVIWVSWEDAHAFCQWVGRRLPTEAEWEKAARGSDGRTYPWGETAPDCSLANYRGKIFGSCQGDTTTVGSYLKGASPYGALDMAGNVWEWVADWYDEGYYRSMPPVNPAGPGETPFGRVARGGSWDSSGEKMRVTERVGEVSTNRLNNLGFRCVLSAEAELPVMATELPAGPTSAPEVTPPPEAARLPWVYTTARGDTCGSIAESLGITVESIVKLNNLPVSCEPLLTGQKLLLPVVNAAGEEILPDAPAAPVQPTGEVRVSAADGMEMVYVEAGVFLRGAAASDTQAGDDERPQQAVYLDDFWIDRTEVTNAMYGRCVSAGVCREPEQPGSKTRLFYYGQGAYERYPVVYVSWQEAQDYCSWAGRRLPSEAEWEKAARGADGRFFPWGNQAADGQLANYNNQVGDTTAVGSYPMGASPYGVLDMAGNAAEWVADWYGEGYYALSPVINPFGPETGAYRVLRGGSWFSLARAIRATFRAWNDAGLRYDSGGFRCAQ